MSHKLDTTNGITSFASAREHAWHRLGTVVDQAMTAQEALEAAQLARWNVRKLPLQIAAGMDAQGAWESLPIVDKYATVRTNPVTGTTDYLGVVGQNYTIIQNEDHAAFFDALLDESGAHFETAGALRGGREVFLTVKMPDTMVVDVPGGKDRTDLYIVILNSHDGSTAFRGLITPIRVVCANTQAAALQNMVSSFSIRHTSGATNAVAAARDTLKLTWKYAEAFEEAVKRMVEAPMERDQAAVILKQVFKVETATSERQERTFMSHVEGALGFLESPANALIKGTRYGVYNAVTEFIDHGWELRGRTGDTLLDTRAERVARGHEPQQLKSKAFELLTV